MDHASYINKLVLSNGDKFPARSAAADQQWISNPWKSAACVHLYHGEDRFNGRGSVFRILWSEQCLSSDSSGCCRNAVFKNMKPRCFREKLMIQLLLSTAEGLKKHHSLGQIFVKAAMFVQLFPLFSSSCWWIPPPIATPALLIFQQADIKTSTSMLTLLTLGHFWQRFKGGPLQILEAVNQQNMTLCRTKKDNWRLPTWSGSHSMPAAMKQHPSLIFHSLSYVQAVSSPIAAPVVASLFMSFPICYQLNSPTWYHQVGHFINSSITWTFICSEMLLSPLEQAACTVWLLELKKERF